MTIIIELIDGPGDGTRLEMLLASPMSIPEQVHYSNPIETPDLPPEFYKFREQREIEGGTLMIYAHNTTNQFAP